MRRAGALDDLPPPDYHAGMDATRYLCPLGAAALRLRVPAKWLRREAEAGRIPCLKAGSRLLFDVDHVAGLLRRRARKGNRP